MARIAAFLSLVLVAGVSALDAQDADLQLEPSARVRVWPVDASEPVIGLLHRIDSDSVAIATTDATLFFARDSVVRMDVSRGVHTDAWRGLKLGALIGGTAGIGVSILAIALTDDEGSGYLAAGVAALTVGGAATGGLLGLGLGAMSRSEHWSRVPMDRVAVRPLVTRRAGRTLIGLRIVR